ncbi:MAG: sialate O-acetylesterase [Steroidobacteraceae bacterium]
MKSSVHRLLGFIGCMMVLAWSGPCLATTTPLMHSMFQDHAVLQRDRPITVWGQAKPGVAVTVTFAGHAAQGTAAANGDWSATLPAMSAGGPYTLTARAADGESETAQDVLVGDVWLCTGQSNMVLWVWAAGEAFFTERLATDSTMRMMTIADTASLTPLQDLPTPAPWVVESPKTVGQFSASCYYFARALKQKVQVPMGMVVAAWGGSLIQDWIGEGTIAKSHLYDRDLKVRAVYARDHRAGYEAWGRMWQDWWKAHAPESMGKPWQPSYDDSGWPVAPDLTAWGTWQDPKVAAFLGDMWYRTTVSLTAAQAAQAAKLSVGKASEEDIAWVNGRPVGSVEIGQALHDIPQGTLHAGTNTIVFNLFCSWMRCGLTAPADQRQLLLADGSKVPLTAPWRYQPVPNEIGMAPREPWGQLGGISMAYNGLIAPLGPYAFRGAIWYQGESNIYWTGPYEQLLTDLMADWRRTYGADLPFLVVQIPNYGAIPTQPAASGWSEVREAQRRAVAKDPHAALAVTIDIGNATNLHPSDKVDVGVRLARAAGNLIYGENVYPSGPEPVGAFRRGASVVVPFKDVTGKLVSYSGAPNAFELCGPTLATCRYARATITGNEVMLTDVGRKDVPTRVRFCWGDSPICTLYDESGLPAGPFELPIGASQAQR